MSMPDLVEKLDKVLDRRVVNRHSMFQLKHFVIGKEPTNQRRLWRCLEEMKVRREGLSGLKTQMDETADNIDKYMGHGDYGLATSNSPKSNWSG